MTAGADVVCKVETEEKCGVIVDGGECVGGDRKEEADDSSYVFVSGGDPDDTGGGNVDGFGSDPLALESNVVEVKDDVNLENGFTVDPPLVVNGHIDKVSGEEEAVVVKSIETEGTPKMIESCPVMVAESDSVIHSSGVMGTKSLSAADGINTLDESVSMPYTVSNADCEVMVNDRTECVSNVIGKADDGSGKPSEDLECEVTVDESESFVSPTEEQEGRVTVDESGKQSEDLECQVSADGPESSVGPIEEQEGQQTGDESGKPSEALVSLVTADERESFESSNKERECVVSVDGSDFVDNQECSGSVESEPSGDHTEEADGKSEDPEVLVITSEINVEAEPTDVYGGLKAEHQSVLVSVPCQSENKKAEGTGIDSVLVLSEDTDALANGQAEKLDGILEMEETQISETKADRSVPLIGQSEEKLEKQMEGSSETPLEVTESVEIEANSEDKKEPVKVEDEIRESQIVAADIAEDDLNLENNTTESANEADVPLETVTDNESLIHVSTTSQYEVNNSIDKPQEGLQSKGSSENIETVDLVISEHNDSELLVVKDSDSLSTPDELTVVEHVQVEDEIRESQIGATDIVENDLHLADNTAESANEAELPLVKETNIESMIHACTASQYEVSSSVDRPQESFQPEGSSENIETVDLVMSKCNNSELIAVKDNNSLSTPDELIVEEQKAEIVGNLGMENIAAEGVDCGPGNENVDVSDDDEKETKVKDAPVEYVPHEVTMDKTSEGMDCGTGVEKVDVSDNEEKGTEVKTAPVESVPHLVKENISDEGTDCGAEVENIDLPDAEEKETEVEDVPVGGHSTLSFSDTIVNSGAVIEFGSIGRHETTHNIQNEEAEDNDGVQSDEVPTSSVEGSVIDAIDVQNEVAEVLPYNFLIRIPRCEDESLREQIRNAQLLVEEKTRLRDAIRVEIQEKRARLKAHNEAYNAAKMEETAARRLVRLKRQEIDSVQVVINRLKNAISVEEIDGRILNMEHMIQHETLLLKDEKQLIREIKQLKTIRDQLTSNMGSPEEIRQAIEQKDQNEERMKTFRKELESLKDKASKAEAVVKTVGKTYNEESRMERELQARFRAADDVRQNVYAQLNSLRKLSYDKNKSFRQFKEDLTAARDFATHGNKDALHRLCANQVETFMEQWNNNDEFRKEYISRCNMNASRRHRALDGGPLVPDDVAPVLPSNVNEKAGNGLVSTPGDVKSVSVVLPVEEGKIVSSNEKKPTDSNSNNKSIENVSGQKNQTLKAKGIAKPTGSRSDDMAVATELAVDAKKEEENVPTKEEIELAKKAEDLRKEEIAAKLKEQRRLEEKAKAIEALERKKRNAEKAQIRAELRARKEAEQKEKEREKRLRKKEKKKTGGGDGSMNVEEAAVASSESANEAATKDTETVSKEKIKRKTTAAAPPPHVLKQQQQLKPKPIPPPLVNRNRKRWQQWGKLALAVAAIFFLFMLGNTSYIRLKFNGLI